MINFILVKPDGDKFRKVDNTKIYKAKDSLKAAKKAFRDNKHLERVYVYNEETKTVHTYLTELFFKDRKRDKDKKRQR